MYSFTFQKNTSDSDGKNIDAYLHAKLTMNEPPPITVEGHFGLNMSNWDNSTNLNLDIEVKNSENLKYVSLLA